MPQGQTTYTRPGPFSNGSAPPLNATNMNAIDVGVENAHKAAPPAGGTTNQVLQKVNNTDYNYQWATISTGGLDQATADGLYVNEVDHTAAAHNALGLSHASLTGLTTGDPHTQYQQESEKDAANG